LLIVSIAKKYLHKYGLRACDLEELVQEGLIKVATKVVDKFDVTKDKYFVSYMSTSVSRLFKTLCIELKSPVHTPISAIRQTNPKGTERKLPWAKVEAPVSLNIITSDGYDYDLLEILEELLPAGYEIGPGRNGFLSEWEQQNLLVILSSVMEQLSPRERDIFTRCWGLKDDYKETLVDTGKTWNIGRERARQIKVKVFKKVRPELLRRWTKFQKEQILINKNL